MCGLPALPGWCGPMTSEDILNYGLIAAFLIAYYLFLRYVCGHK